MQIDRYPDSNPTKFQTDIRTISGKKKSPKLSHNPKIA